MVLQMPGKKGMLYKSVLVMKRTSYRVELVLSFQD